MNILYDEEKVPVESMTGAGGYFKTEAGLKYMAAAMKTSVSAMETAGEGGAWGIALLADYLVYRKPDEQLDDYLQNHVFAGMKQMTVSPDAEDEKGFNRYMERFVSCIPAQKAAADCFKN